MPRLHHPVYAGFYAHTLPMLRTIAKLHGYCMAVHGWIEDAKDPEIVIAAFKEAIGGEVGKIDGPTPSSRPHGRLAWSFYLDEESAAGADGPYLDISVMPKLKNPLRARTLEQHERICLRNLADRENIDIEIFKEMLFYMDMQYGD